VCLKRYAPSCDMFNLGSSYFHVALTTVRHLLTVTFADTPVIIGGRAAGGRPTCSEAAAAAAVTDCEASTCITGLAYTCSAHQSTAHLSSASSLPSLLSHDNDSVVRSAVW